MLCGWQALHKWVRAPGWRRGGSPWTGQGPAPACLPSLEGPKRGWPGVLLSTVSPWLAAEAAGHVLRARSCGCGLAGGRGAWGALGLLGCSPRAPLAGASILTFDLVGLQGCSLGPATSVSNWSCYSRQAKSRPEVATPALSNQRSHGQSGSQACPPLQCRRLLVGGGDGEGLLRGPLTSTALSATLILGATQMWAFRARRRLSTLPAGPHRIPSGPVCSDWHSLPFVSTVGTEAQAA